MEALLVEISFFEAFFKVHHTKGFRLSYPMPLPTTVAGIFGAFLGIEREKLTEEFKEMLFGAKLISHKGITSENVTFLQYKSESRIEKGVAPLMVINEPTYLIAIAGEERKISEIKGNIKNSINFLPYGGQNDFFVKDWKVIDVKGINESNEISNYAPQDLVKNVRLEKRSEIQFLPVRHKISENQNFCFVINGVLELKESVPCVEGGKIGLYKLEEFEYQKKFRLEEEKEGG